MWAKWLIVLVAAQAGMARGSLEGVIEPPAPEALAGARLENPSGGGLAVPAQAGQVPTDPANSDTSSGSGSYPWAPPANKRGRSGRVPVTCHLRSLPSYFLSVQRPDNIQGWNLKHRCPYSSNELTLLLSF